MSVISRSTRWKCLLHEEIAHIHCRQPLDFPFVFGGRVPCVRVQDSGLLSVPLVRA
jgi:hypothetical protein